MVGDLTGRPLRESRVLDLGCYEGQFAVEFASRGAQALGIEGREVSTGRARERAAQHGVESLELITGDVRELSRERFGTFDVVLCLGCFTASISRTRLLAGAHR